jgi:polyhydroxyalkanoate synthase
VRFEIVPGGHLGMLTGRAARGSTWRVLDEWVGEWSTTDAATPAAKKAVRKKAAAKKAATKPATKKTAIKKAAGKKTAKKAPTTPADSPESIGVNPDRRYGSAGSRSLAR